MHTVPLNAPLCPICGQSNDCAASAKGSFDTDCWCVAVVFTEELLAKVPPELRGKSCVCRGRANTELIGLVAKHFNVAKSAVTITSGAGARMKLVGIAVP